MQKSNQDIEVVVIEDDVDVQDLLRAYFMPRGYSMTFFDSPIQLLEEAKKRNLYADVIITDLLLPEISGTELIKKLRSWGLTLPCILITSKSSIQTAYDAISAGAFDFIVKPLHLPQLEISLQRAVRFKEVLHENNNLRQALKEKTENYSDQIVAKSPGFRAALDLARRVAHSNANILITGESGTGKEVISRTIHETSNRANGPFVAINCAAIPETLLEAELFGYAKGSFTGAIDKKMGLFEEAEGGTLFLDEIGDMSLPLQAKLLRVLQDRKIKRIGENRLRDVDVRIVAATHRNLKLEVAEHRFREDLYFRLNVIPIHIPPLRERPEDIIPLAEFFLRRYAIINQTTPKKFSKDTLSILLKHQWTGNVRELENTVERAAVLSDQEEINPLDLLMESGYPSDMPRPASVAPVSSTFATMPSSTPTSPLSSYDFKEESQPASTNSNPANQFLLEDVIKGHIIKILEFNKGAKDKTAKMLGIDRKTLYRKLNEYGY